MRILVTGATGHIGGAIHSHFASLGHDVISVSRNGAIRADITAPDFVDQVVAVLPRCDAIVHSAASLSKRNDDVSLSLVNGVGIQNVIRLADRTAARQLIHLSGLPVIGRPITTPIDENHPVNSATAYHASKYYGEQLVRLAASSRLLAASFRITSPVGPGTPPGRIFSEFSVRARRGEPLMLAGRGGRRQDYVDVRDIATAVEQALEQGVDGVFNIASGVAVSNLELARACIDTLQSRSVISFSEAADPDEDVAWVVSVDKARRGFGYRPRHGLADSISAFAQYP